MKEEGCPYLSDCFIIGSLQAINEPLIRDFCYRNHENCRYYRRRLGAEDKGLKEAWI